MSTMTPPCFTPATFIKKFPIGDHYCKALQSIYIDRGGDRATMDKAVEKIVERQKLIESSDLDWGPICIYAEGATSNGLNLGRFRRGGFSSGLAVKPIWHKYDYKLVDPDMTNLMGSTVCILMFSSMNL